MENQEIALPTHIAVEVVFKAGVCKTDCRKDLFKVEVNFNTVTGVGLLETLIEVKFLQKVAEKSEFNDFKWNKDIYCKPTVNTPQKGYLKLDNDNYRSLFLKIYKISARKEEFNRQNWKLTLFCYTVKSAARQVQRATGARIQDQLTAIDQHIEQYPPAEAIGSLQKHYLAVQRARQTVPGPIDFGSDHTSRQLHGLDNRAAAIPHAPGPNFVSITIKMNNVAQVIEIDTNSLRAALNLPTLVQNREIAQMEGNAGDIENQEDVDHADSEDEEAF